MPEILLVLSSAGAFAQTPSPADSARPQQYTYIEKMPVFPVLAPGDSTVPSNQRFRRFVNADVHFPAKALRDGVSGRVFFSFAVNAQGRTQDIKLVKGLRDDVDAEVLRNAHRLDAIQWEPGTQNGRPVTVSFTVPISFNINEKQAVKTLGDSLDTGRYDHQVAFPLSSWESKRWPAPKGKGMIYGTCLQRLGGTSSLGVAEYVRLVNLTTHKSVSFSVKPAMKSRRENGFFYALPAGRYALHLYVYPDKIWGPYRLYFENLRKPVAPSPNAPLRQTRYQFTVESGKVHYVGTWNLANENQPEFLDEKYQIDPAIQAYFPQFNFKEAVLALPQ
ncbi:energy transducer TonB [Hymenobacter rubidus]|uniref:energy transducer TonB n=1 Tax=Hymenobacter rubidus TaxID=1441626 RepID=UPI00191D8E0B|nr:energy transducer TonB [Hymenobacter rubidus]